MTCESKRVLLPDSETVTCSRPSGHSADHLGICDDLSTLRWSGSATPTGECVGQEAMDLK